tara:strand:- start:3577 stop:4206 length:630 start_codon:yes stop_codon:yes gene_type:complete
MELLVPYKVDFEEREKNKKDFIKHYENYKVNIIQDYDERCKAYNKAAKESTSKYIALADIDAIIPHEQMSASLDKLDSGADVVYPYNNIINIHRDGREPTNDWPVGYYYGCMVIFNRKKFLKFGGENEQFIGYGWEDLERYYRAINYGLSIDRVEGNCYHMQHPRNMVSNPYFKSNYKLMLREKNKCKNLTYNLDTTQQFLTMLNGSEN